MFIDVSPKAAHATHALTSGQIHGSYCFWRVPGDEHGSICINLVPDITYCVGCVADSQNYCVHGPQDLALVKHRCDVQVLFQELSLLKEQGEIQHGNSILNEVLTVLWQPKTVLNPVLYGGALHWRIQLASRSSMLQGQAYRSLDR